MIKDIVYKIYFGITLPLTYFLFAFPAQILNLFGKYESSKKMIAFGSGLASRHYFKATGSSILIEGLENLPKKTKNLCIVSNHQSYYDILVIIGYVPILVGFLAKKELSKIPMLNGWMHGMGCIFLDRSSPHAAVRAIEKGVQSIKDGNAITLFPEGTRSKSQKMGSFKPGSLKLAIRAGATIVPVSLNNSFKIYEENRKVKKANVKMVIHKPIDVTHEEYKDSKVLSDKLWATINSGLIQ